MYFKNNYYISSFFWSTLAKIFTAIVGFISVPLLLGYYGKADYGILSIATACNGYMHLLDLGMNIGAVKFFSQWKAEDKIEKIYRVARTNITFYALISVVNIMGLLVLAFCGESLFSITHSQFLQLRICLIILAIFCLISWSATTFNQLLISDKQMAFTMQMQCIIAVLKGLLVFMVFTFHLSLSVYFLFFTMITSSLIIPYVLKCRKSLLIDSIRPAMYWKEFKIVLSFSLSIFALSLFQMTATQSRPIVLSMFANDGASVVADYRILEVIPQFVIMICGTLSGIFLPKTSEIFAKGDKRAVKRFAYRGTVLTSILACSLCIPLMLSSKEILVAYVGSEHATLYPWLFLWLILVLCQIHSTPANALILANGKTKPLVVVSGVACLISIIINAFLATKFNVGSAVIGYSIYILITLLTYYLLFYKKLLGIDRIKILLSFLVPCTISIISMLAVNYLTMSICIDNFSERINMLMLFTIKSILFLLIYFVLIYVTKIVRYKDKKFITFIDSYSK